MTETQGIAAVTIICALILVGRAVLRRRLPPRSMLLLIAFWGAVIVLGTMIAKLWMAHQS